MQFVLRWGTVTFDGAKISGECLDGTPFELPATQDQVTRWMGGEYVQDVFPDLTVGQREMLISGMSEVQFDRLFNEDEEVLV